MYFALSPGALGMRVNNLQEAIKIAQEAGYEGVEINIGEIAALIDERGTEHVNQMFAAAGVRPAGWGLPVDYRGDEATWRKGLQELPRFAQAAQAIGCHRVMTWITPGSNTLTYDENRRFHIERFKPIAAILGEHGCRLGLEFIGPKTIRDGLKYPFIYRMEDMLAMGAEIGPNVGLLLDCWHWYTSGGTLEELRTLKNEQVVYVHVNDAPRGVPADKQLDGRRALPGATGVIDLVGFLQVLNAIGYDGPIVPEPFSNPAIWVKQLLDEAWRKTGLPDRQ
jgi:sugar phosphate isomerase/epimerase